MAMVKYLFLHSGQLPPDQLVLDSVDRLLIPKYDYFITIEGTELEVIPVDKNTYRIQSSAVYKYFRDHNLPYHDSARDKFIREINEDIDNDPSLVYRRESGDEQYIEFEPFIPAYYLEKSYSWISYMIDNQTEKIIGIYHGYGQIDKLGRLYNKFSKIEIHPQYQGRGLCTPFSQFTYYNVVAQLGITYLNIHMAAKIKYGACKCYVNAALNSQLRVFVNGSGQFREIVSPDDCVIYNKFPETKMIITNGIDYDRIMEGTY